MKKLLLAVMVLGAMTFPKLSHSQGVPPPYSPSSKSGQQLVPYGQYGNYRLDSYGDQGVTEGHARYFLPANNGHIFTLSTAAYTIVAANVYTDAIGTIVPIIGLFNPVGSGVLDSLIEIHADIVSGTPGGPLMQLYYCGINVTSKISSYNLTNNYLNNAAGASMAVPQGGTGVLASSPASTATPLILGPLGGPAAIAAGVYNNAPFNIDGKIVVPPGCVYWLASYATGTNDLRNYSIQYEEVPIAQAL